MFQFSAFASISNGYHASCMVGCPIRKSSDQFVFANPRSLSQLIASFFASESLGIPRVPLFTFFATWPFCHHAADYSLSIKLYIDHTTTFAVLYCVYSLFSQYVKELFCNRYLYRSIVENNGFEPLTPCVQGRCSSQLS